MNAKEEIRPINQWVALNRILFLYKAAAAALALLLLILGVLTFVLAMADPVVVIKDRSDQNYFSGSRQPAELTEDDIAAFVKNFIQLRYEWKTLDPKTIAKNISPLVTDGFERKSFTVLIDLKNNKLGGKTASQHIAGLEVNVTKDQTSATFDRVLRVEGIPLVIPTQVSFVLVKGSPTRWNPLGLFINATTIHEGN